MFQITPVEAIYLTTVHVLHNMLRKNYNFELENTMYHIWFDITHLLYLNM